MQRDEAETTGVPAQTSAGPPRRSRWRTLAPFAIWLLLGLAIWAVAPILNALSIGGFTVAYAVAALGAPVGLALAAVWAAGPWGGAGASAARADLSGGLAIAAPWLGGAGVMATLSSLYGLGFDGLLLVVGLMGGLLLAILFSLSQPSEEGNAASPWTGSVVLIPGLVLSLALVISAEIQAVRLLTPYLSGSDNNSIAVGLAGTATILALAALMARGVMGLAQSVAAIVLLAGLGVLAIAIGMQVGGPLGAVPHIAYGEAIRDIGSLERTLVLAERADPVDLKPFARPYTGLSLENVAALALTVMLGMAVLHAVLVAGVPGRAPADASQAQRSAAKTLAWAAVVLALGLVTLPSIASFAKRDLYRHLAMGDGTGTTLPVWFDSMALAGHAKVCRLPLDVPESATSACAPVEDAVRLGDVHLTADGLLPAMAAMGGLPPGAVFAVSLGLALTALLSAAHLLAMLSSGRRSSTARLLLAATTAGLGAAAALLVEASLTTRVLWALTVAVAALLPPVLIATALPRANPWALAASALAGLALCLYYIIGVTWFPIAFVDTWQALSSAPDWRMEELAELRRSCTGGHTASCEGASSVAAAVANWRGLDTRAAGLPGAVVGLLVGLVLALLLPARRATVGQ